MCITHSQYCGDWLSPYGFETNFGFLLNPTGYNIPSDNILSVHAFYSYFCELYLILIAFLGATWILNIKNNWVKKTKKKKKTQPTNKKRDVVYEGRPMFFGKMFSFHRQ